MYDIKFNEIVNYLKDNSLVAEHLEFMFYDADCELRKVTVSEVTDMLHQILGPDRLQYTGRDLVPVWRFIRAHRTDYSSFYFAN